MAKIPAKSQFKIAEVCQLTGTEPYVLRYWESEFPILEPAKGRSGQRVYKKKDIEIILRIKDLLYKEGYTIAGARRKLMEEADDGGTDGANGDGAQATPTPAPERPAGKPAPRKKPAAGKASPQAQAGAPPADPASAAAPRLRKALRDVRSGLQQILDELRKDPA